MKKLKGKIIAVSAPSGAGKTTIVKQMLKLFPEIIFSVSATTRSKRPGEINGKDYFFISEDEFKEKIKNNEFIEWERFYDYYYGTYKYFIDEITEQNKAIILEVDVKGALQLKKIYPEAKLIFIYPPSSKELINRLKNRKTETAADFDKRIKRAKMELSLKDKFDYFVENNDLDKAILETRRIIKNILTEKS